jgi:uncharacterized protein (DUF983 family)
MSPMSRVLESLSRGARLRCPCCGFGPLFRSRFHMYERCSACDEPFEREPGQSLGSVYINVGLSEALVVAGFMLTDTLTRLSLTEQLALWMPAAAVTPLLLFRFAKGLWTSIVFLGEGLYLDWPGR